MSLTSLIAITLVSFIAQVVLLTVLLYISARCWKVATISMRRAATVCAALIAINVVFGIPALLVARNSDPSGAGFIFALLFLLAAIFLQWYSVKLLMRTGGGRAAGVFLTANLPLVLLNMLMAAALRIYVMEAYVVPTGAMAPTIIGAHADRLCPNCGCRFEVSLSDWVTRGAFGKPRRQEIHTECPNCHQSHIVDVKAKLHSGDRILCDKTSRPERWSLGVFINPQRRTENYVKRLVGLSGETMQIAGGEVFADGKLLRKDPAVATDLWLPVNDTVLVPKELGSETPRWQPRDKSSHWHNENGRWARDGEDAGRDFLDFAGRVTDFVAYNDHNPNYDYPRPQPVGDVLVTVAITTASGPGKFGFEWQFADASVAAHIESNGQLLIECRAGVSIKAVRSRAVGRLEGPLARGDTLAFAVRDGQAYLLHNTVLAALAAFGPDDPETIANNQIDEAGCRIALVTDGCAVDLSRITVHRDVYYLGNEMDANLGSEMGTSTATFIVPAGECFMLGDNSPRSADSRFIGTVPMADVLGVVRWLYWPPSRWHEFH